jgi:hypothetical protein
VLGVGMCPYFERNTLNDPHMTTLFGKSHAALVSAFGSFVVVNTRLRCWQSKGGKGCRALRAGEHSTSGWVLKLAQLRIAAMGRVLTAIVNVVRNQVPEIPAWA